MKIEIYLRDNIGRIGTPSLRRTEAARDRTATLEELETQLAGSGALFLEPRNLFDLAIVGIAELGHDRHVLAYDSEWVVQALMTHEHWDEDAAREWYHFNIAGAYAGQGTPLFIEPYDNN